MTNTKAGQVGQVAMHPARAAARAQPTIAPERGPAASLRATLGNSLRTSRHAAHRAAPRASEGSWQALASLSVAVLLSSLGNSIAHVALPTLAVAFTAPFQAVQWVVLAYLLASTMLVVAAGRLGDVFGRRRLLVAGILAFALASVGAGLAPSLGVLVAARGAQGLAAALMLALSMALVAEAVPKDRTGSAMGVLGTMSAVGTAMGPSLGGALIAMFGWRSIFFVNVPLGLVGCVLVLRHLRPDARLDKPPAARFDHLGALVMALTLGAYALSMTLGRGSFGLRNLALLFAAAVGVGLFVLVERRAIAPLVQLADCHDPVLRAGLATSLLISTVMMATLVVGPFHLIGALGLDMVQVGLAMSVGPATAAMCGAPAGRLVDRIGAHRVMLAGLGGLVVGCSAIAVLPLRVGIPGYLLPIVATTAGYSAFQAANNTAVMADVPSDRRGVVSGLLHLSRNLGLVTGAAVLGAVFAAASGAHDPTGASADAVALGTRATFAVGACLSVAASAVALRAQALARRAQRSSCPSARGGRQ